MRLFLASFLSLENTAAYESLVADVIADVPDTIRPVPSRTQHLTIVFLGDVADADLSTCLQILECVREIDAFSFALSPPRILFSRRSPRLICADLASESESVAMLQMHLYRELSDRLQASLTRPKPPHVTLARFRKHANREAARRVIESLSKKDDPTTVRTDRLAKVQLVKSTLTPKGPVYESIGESKCRT
jgi:2'-5' RNA ligase